MFKFNFNTGIDEDTTKNNESSHKKLKTENIEDQKLFKCEEIIYEPKTDEVYEEDLNILRIGQHEIKYLNTNFLITENFSEDIIKAEDDHSDLITGVYEGGLKVWECTFDLANYMNEKVPELFKDKVVLDLGCGCGILGILAQKLGSKIVHFQDYNKDVLITLTTRNSRLNCEKSGNFRFFSGDWADFMEKTENDEKYDIIITAETIYNTENYSKLMDFLKNRLKEDGLVLLAAKTYYFGVGGGLRLFEKAISEHAYFSSEIVWKCEVGVKREILKLSKK